MKACFYVIATESHEKQYQALLSSLRHFHPDTPIVRFDDRHVKEANDPHLFYRATPYFAKKLMDEGYELVIKLDADQIVTGSLDHLLTGDYEVGTVLNYNRVDPKRYGIISVGTIDPATYFNCGLVAMTSRRFVEHWLRLCFGEHFGRMQYREQDLLNVITHYGDYDVRCFDAKLPDYSAWHGLIAKGEGLKMVIRGGELVLPAQEDGYPQNDKLIKVLHNAGGKNEKPVNETYRTQFTEEVIGYIESLIHG